MAAGESAAHAMASAACNGSSAWATRGSVERGCRDAAALEKAIIKILLSVGVAGETSGTVVFFHRFMPKRQVLGRNNLVTNILYKYTV